MHLGKIEKTFERGGIRRLKRNIFVRTHLQKRMHLETATLEKRSGGTSGGTLKKTLEGFSVAQDWLSSGFGANIVFGSDCFGDALGDWDVLPSQSAQLRREFTITFCIFRYKKFLKPSLTKF